MGICARHDQTGTRGGKFSARQRPLYGAADGQDRAAAAGHGERSFGDEQAEDQARGHPCQAVELVLAEDGGSQRGDQRAGENTKG